MPTVADLTAGQVMDSVAPLLNDSEMQVYTYAVQVPYLNTALRELQEYYELNNMPVTDTVSTVIEVPAGTTAVGYEPAVPVPNTPYLPDDLIEPKIVWERQHDVDPFIIMNKVDFLPRWQEGVELNQFIWYTWQSQQIRVLAANQANDLKLDYTRNLFSEIEDETDTINVVNAQSFLQYRTAALCARFIGEDIPRADQLDQFAGLSMDRSVGIGTKGRQAIVIRKRPFRSSYKRLYNI